MSASRFTFPHVYEPHMHREETLTLSRTVSPQNAIPKSKREPPPSNSASPKPVMASHPAPIASKSAPEALPRQKFVFADPVAFRYLEDDPTTTVVERRGRLKGYEIYLVEQWACSRVHPTFVITTYTGDPNHSVVVGVLSVPASEEDWSPTLRVYFNAISQFHARPKETPLGIFLVTNLSSFPSALTVMPVPDGDVGKHREDFVVNENLKRLGCSGRSGMSLSNPAGATQAKFLQLYKTSERISLYGAVIELVKLCQVALTVFGKLEQEYADGMLCDVTEKAVNDWWTEIGSEHYNIEPTDGILGPTTVAALLGMLIGARNRLNYYGAPVSKDAFDVATLKRGIAYFQKSQKMERTRRLDRHTLNRLHKVTAKAAAGDAGWAVPKAVKSTVAELSGKGGEMVMGMVGRDKAGIGDIETLDIDRFVSLVHGERAKWLWHGKPRRTGASEGRSDVDIASLTFTKDDQGGYIWSHSRTESAVLEEDPEMRKRDKESPNDASSGLPQSSSASMIESPFERDPQLRKTVFKSVTGKMSDARSGFGRIKDAVGFRGHSSRHSKDDGTESEGRGLGSYFGAASSTTLDPGTGAPGSPQAGVSKAFTWKDTPMDYQNGHPKVKDHVSSLISSAHIQGSESTPNSSLTSLPLDHPVPQEEMQKDEAAARWTEQIRDIRQSLVAADPSVAGSVYSEGDLEGPVLEADRKSKNGYLLHRRHSVSNECLGPERLRNEAWWPRSMSFSDAEDAVLAWEPVGVLGPEVDDSDLWVTLQRQKYMSRDFQDLYEKASDLQGRVAPWVGRKVGNVDAIDAYVARDQEDFQRHYYLLSDSYNAVRESSQAILTDERSHITELIKDVEVLGAKLEYEINALVSKVEDVNDGVAQFERQVEDLEGRAAELEEQLNAESWIHWLARSITGIGTVPNVTGRRRP